MPAEQAEDIVEIVGLWKANPCGSMVRGWKNADDVREELLAARLDARKQLDGATALEVARGHVECNTPLVVSFDDAAVPLVAADAHRFAFHAGEPVASAWPTAAPPWLALDRDGDGWITSGAELFGDAAPAAGGGLARDGFAALAALDANRDGVLVARDPAFAQLVLWSDRDGDHRSSPDELVPLSSRVDAISLAPAGEPRCDADGNCESGRAAVRWHDAAGVHAGAVVDVYLSSRCGQGTGTFTDPRCGSAAAPRTRP